MKLLARAVCTAALLIAGGRLAGAQAPAVPPPPAAPQDPTADALRISVADCKQALEKKQAIAVDVRGEDAFRAGHIPGAVLLPGGSDLKARAEELKQSGKPIVTYCS